MVTPLPTSATAAEAALTWKTYSVRGTEKAELLRFITDGLVLRGCRILDEPNPSRAPFYIVFETPAGERQGVLAYARKRRAASGYWDAKLARNIARDKLQSAQLFEMGWALLVIWECESVREEELRQRLVEFLSPA